MSIQNEWIWDNCCRSIRGGTRFEVSISMIIFLVINPRICVYLEPRSIVIIQAWVQFVSVTRNRAFVCRICSQSHWLSVNSWYGHWTPRSILNQKYIPRLHAKIPSAWSLLFSIQSDKKAFLDKRVFLASCTLLRKVLTSSTTACSVPLAICCIYGKSNNKWNVQYVK